MNMEPTVTIIYYVLVSFFGYFIGANLYDQRNFRIHDENTKYQLDLIGHQISRIDTRLLEMKSEIKQK